MSEKSSSVHYTYADYVRFPDDGKRYEIIDGEKLLTPSPKPRHQIVSSNLEEAMRVFVRRRRLGLCLSAPIDVVLADDCIVQPDLLFIAKQRRSLVGESYISGPPDLVVEVLSPSTSKRDLVTKRELYARFGVREYWIVDPERRSVSVYVLEKGRFELEETADSGEVRSLEVLPGFSIAFEDVFLDT